MENDERYEDDLKYSHMLDEFMGQIQNLSYEYIEKRLYEIINKKENKDISIKSLESVFKQTFGKYRLNDVYETNMCLRLLDYIEFNKYAKLCINARYILSASLINGFTLNMIPEMFMAVDYNNPSVFSEYLDFSHELKNAKKKIERFYLTIDINKCNTKINEHRLFAKLFIKGRDESQLYKNALAEYPISVISDSVEHSKKMVWNDMFYAERKIRYTKGEKNDDRINIYDSSELLAFFILYCGEYDSKLYPLGKENGTVHPYNDYIERRFSSSKYEELLYKCEALYKDEFYNEKNSLTDSVKAVYITQKEKFNKLFGIYKFNSLYKHYKFLTKDIVVQALSEIYQINEIEKVKEIIIDNVFNDDVIDEILHYDSEDPLILFEYSFMLLILDSMMVFKQYNGKDGLVEIIRESVKKMMTTLKSSKTVYLDYYYDSIDTEINQICELTNQGKIDVEKTEKKLVTLLINNSFYKNYYSYNIDEEEYRDFLNNKINYEILKNFILENVGVNKKREVEFHTEQKMDWIL